MSHVTVFLFVQDYLSTLATATNLEYARFGMNSPLEKAVPGAYDSGLMLEQGRQGAPDTYRLAFLNDYAAVLKDPQVFNQVMNNDALGRYVARVTDPVHIRGGGDSYRGMQLLLAAQQNF